MPLRVPRPDPLCVVFALAGALGLFMLSGRDPYWSDWGFQGAPAVSLLLRGDVTGFIDTAPGIYLGSLLARAPIFLTAGVFGGGAEEAFFAAKGVALLVLAGLAGWLLTHARAAGAGIGGLLLITFVTAGNPIAGRSLDYGHAEDLMAACCAIFGVVAAGRGRLTTAGVLIGVGFVLKQWVILAWLPALAVAPKRPWQVLVIAASLGAAFFLPLLFRGGGIEAVPGGLQTQVGDIWRSHQLFWPLGIENPDPDAMRPQLAPEWFLPLPRLIIVGMSIPLTWLWYRRRRAGSAAGHDVLLLLAVLFLGRCLFEPWNVDYYHLPFLLTLATWEVLRGRLPLLALTATGATYFSFVTWTNFELYGNATYAMYMSWTLPLGLVLVRTLLFPDWRLPMVAPATGTSTASG